MHGEADDCPDDDANDAEAQQQAECPDGKDGERKVAEGTVDIGRATEHDGFL